MEQMKYILPLSEGLKSFKERIAVEREARILASKDPLSFGVDFLDDAFGGINKNDIVVVGAKTGLGKTALATLIAMHNALLGKRVAFIALEAEENEIERRAKYQIISRIYYGSISRMSGRTLNYTDWHSGKFDDVLLQHEKDINEFQGETYKTLKTFYRTSENYTVQDFEKQFLSIKSETDLVVVDHLHYFDFEDDNENRAMKSIVKKCRDLALSGGVPVILIAHMRKTDKRYSSPVPDLEDFHGSSDISKIATKAIIIAPAYDVDSDKPNEWPTFFRAAKSRLDSARTRHIGLLKYNSETQSYLPGYKLGKFEDKDFIPIGEQSKMPYWATHGEIVG